MLPTTPFEISSLIRNQAYLVACMFGAPRKGQGCFVQRVSAHEVHVGDVLPSPLVTAALRRVAEFTLRLNKWFRAGFGPFLGPACSGCRSQQPSKDRLRSDIYQTGTLITQLSLVGSWLPHSKLPPENRQACLFWVPEEVGKHAFWGSGRPRVSKKYVQRNFPTEFWGAPPSQPAGRARVVLWAARGGNINRCCPCDSQIKEICEMAMGSTSLTMLSHS